MVFLLNCSAITVDSGIFTHAMFLPLPCVNCGMVLLGSLITDRLTVQTYTTNFEKMFNVDSYNLIVRCKSIF